jgi:hypothetical protein
MRLLLLILGICVGIACFEKPAEAQNYPWCLIYGTDFGGKNCGFTTFQQCQDTVSGIGGFCMQNNTYEAPQLLGPRARRTRTSLR